MMMMSGVFEKLSELEMASLAAHVISMSLSNDRECNKMTHIPRITKLVNDIASYCML